MKVFESFIFGKDYKIHVGQELSLYIWASSQRGESFVNLAATPRGVR